MACPSCVHVPHEFHRLGVLDLAIASVHATRTIGCRPKVPEDGSGLVEDDTRQPVRSPTALRPGPVRDVPGETALPRTLAERAIRARVERPPRCSAPGMRWLTPSRW